MTRRLAFTSSLLGFFLTPALRAQERNAIPINLPWPFEDTTLSIERQWLPWLIAFGGLIMLARYGPETLDRIRDSVGQTRRLKMALELERMKLENLKLKHEVEKLRGSQIGVSPEAAEGSASIVEPLDEPAKSWLGERRAKRWAMVRSQIEHPELRKPFMWSRAAAFVVDMFLGYTGVALITEWFGIPWGQETFEAPDLLIVLYFWTMWSTREATVGMMLFGLRLVRLDGHEITASDGLKRLVIWPFVIPFLWTPFDRHKQSLHDKWPKTLVVKERGSFEDSKFTPDTVQGGTVVDP